MLTHRDSEGEQSVSEQITYQSPLDDVTVDLSTDQNRALHHINSMRLTAAGEHEWKSYSRLIYDQFMTWWPKLMPGKGLMIITVCCNNAGKVKHDELLFDYIMLCRLKQQSAKRIRRRCVHSPFVAAFLWFRRQILHCDCLSKTWQNKSFLVLKISSQITERNWIPWYCISCWNTCLVAEWGAFSNYCVWGRTNQKETNLWSDNELFNILGKYAY